MVAKRLIAPGQIEQLKDYYLDGRMSFPYQGGPVRARTYNAIAPLNAPRNQYKLVVTFLREELAKGHHQSN